MNLHQQTTPPLLDAALNYAACGLEIFPVNETSKAPKTEHGMKDATSDPAQIVAWWTRWPDALIGCRIPKDRVVLDIDPRHGGHETWAELESAYAPIPYGRRHHSGRDDGGFHIWAKRPPGKLRARPLHEWARRNGVGRPAGKRSWTSGIDILHHDHRYTILPPSPHPATGNPYMWDREDQPLELPPYLINLITVGDEPAATVQPMRVVRDPDSIADWYTANHSWHDILPAAGWQLIQGGGDEDGSKWRHPNASAESSASIKHGCLFVYSTNTDFPVTEEGDPNGITRFRAWAILEHDDNLSNAARTARQLYDGHPTMPTFSPQTPSSNGAWPDPTPLNPDHQHVPFPLDALPDWMAAHVAQVADEFQVAADLPAMLAMTATSICCARRAVVIVQGTWREPCCLYLVAAAAPGEGKSPVVRQMVGFLDRYEHDLVDRTARQRDEARVRRSILEKEHTKAINAGDTAQAMATADELRNIPEPVVPRLMADDVTPEKLAEMIAEQGGRMALVSTEGGVFELMTGRYSDKLNLDVYLKAWSGDPIRIDRLGRQAAGVILDPALTVGLTVQPTVIKALADHPELAGRGLTARFMYAFPPSSVGHRTMNRASHIDRDVTIVYETQLLDLIDRLTPHADQSRHIPLHDNARNIYFNWRQNMEDRCRPGGDLHHMVEWVTKLGSTVARLAGCFTLADRRWEIDEQSMERAIAVGRYWEAQSRTAHDMWLGVGAAVMRAEKIIRWLLEERPAEFTMRDVCRANRTISAEVAAEALRLLVDNSWIRVVDGRPVEAGRRGTPSPSFTPHPRLSSFRNIHVPLSQLSLNNQKSITSSSSQFPSSSRDTGHEGHDIEATLQPQTAGAPVDNPQAMSDWEDF